MMAIEEFGFAVPLIVVVSSVMTLWSWGMRISNLLLTCGVGVGLTFWTVGVGLVAAGLLFTELLARFMPNKIIPPRMTPKITANNTSLRIGFRLKE